MSRSILYTSSPLLASRTPVWRSKFIVAALALGFGGLAARAAYVQVVGNDFFQRQGEVRFARTLELPAHRGRIMDRNGLLLASNVVAPSIWAIPEDVESDDAEVKAKLRQLAQLLGVPLAELNKKLEDEDKTFVWLKRQVDEPVAQQIAALNIKGIYQRKEYKRKYPEGEAAAHVVGFANVENHGQEGVELAFDKSLAGRPGSRRVIKDRLGRVVEDVGEQVPPVDGRDIQLSIDSKVQFFAYQKLKSAVLENKAKAGSVVVLDSVTGEVLALANYPSYVPDKRQNLTGAQLRNIALTDVFEPGRSRQDPDHRLDHFRLPSAWGADGGGGDPEIEQRRHGQAGHADAAARDVGNLFSCGFRSEAAAQFPGCGFGPAAALQIVAADRTGHHVLRLWPVGLAVPDGAFLHRVCP